MITCKTLFLSMGLCLPVVASAAAQTSSAPAAAPAVSPETLDAMFQRMDKNDDKMLSLDEFKAGIVARERAIVLVRLQAQFKSMDKNNSGALEPTEFYELPLMKSGGSNVPTFTAADTDRDQKLNFKEYVALVGKYAASRQPARKP